MNETVQSLPLRSQHVTSKDSGSPDHPAGNHTVDIFVQVVDEPAKLCPAFAYLGRPKDPSYGREITIALNRAHWPTAGALARADGRTLRWLAACALLERLAPESDRANFGQVRNRLLQLAFGRPADVWERVLWAAYALKDAELFAPLEKLLSLPADSRFLLGSV